MINVVGVAGLPRSGKDSLAELFIKRGYYGVSLGDIMREASRIRHANEPDPISVKNMTETANYLREKNGADYALRQALERFNEAQAHSDYKGLIIYSVRAPIEADFIRKNGGRLIWVDSSDEVRYQRMLEHLREGEVALSLSEMRQQEALQELPKPGSPPEAQMNTTYVREQATDIIENNGDDFQAFLLTAAETFDLNQDA